MAGSVAIDKIIKRLWLMLLEGKLTNQKQIEVLYKDARDELIGLENRANMVRARLKLLREACKHPSMGAENVCPDCGYDDER